MKDIILFGIQGSGKGTQARMLVNKYKYKLFETGTELRIMAKSDSELGKRLKTIMDSGKLVDTNIIMEIVEVFCNNLKNNENVIFDGIPRNIEQMKLFEKIMKRVKRKPIPINIKLSEKDSLNRISGRFICEGVDMSKNPLMTESECIALGGKVTRRSDDNEKAIKVRINAFKEETIPVIIEYKKDGRLIEVEGNNSVDYVFNTIEDFIK